MLPDSIERAVYGMVVTPALHLADSSGMLMHLLVDAPLSAADLALRIRSDENTIERILLVLAAADLVDRDTGGRFQINSAAAPFVDQHDPGYIGGFVAHLIEGMPDMLPRLKEYLSHGKDVVDIELPEPYDRFYANETSTEDFMRAMWSLSYDVSRELVELVNLSDTSRLIDVGGANGPFAVAALQNQPDLHAVVFDLPRVGPHLEASRRKYGLRNRLDFVGGDFFRDDLPTGDAIALGYVMSNWPDEACTVLLNKAFRACQPGGRLLVMDRLFDPDKSGPLSTAVMHLTMQIETRGVHRTPAEFSDLISAVGFQDITVRRSTRDKHLILARRPS